MDMVAPHTAALALDVQRRSLLAAFRHQDVVGKGALQQVQLVAIARLILMPEATDAEIAQFKLFLQDLADAETGEVRYADFVDWLYPPGAAPTMATAVVSTSPQLDATASPVVAASSPLELGASIIEPVAEAATSPPMMPRSQPKSWGTTSPARSSPGFTEAAHQATRFRRRELPDTIGQHEVELHTQATKATEEYADPADAPPLGVSVGHLNDVLLPQLKAAYRHEADPDFYSFQDHRKARGASSQWSYVETLDMREVGKATLVVSCPWTCGVRTCVDVIGRWCANRGLELRRCFVWHCAFCCRQGRSKQPCCEDPELMLVQRMQSIPNLLAVLTPWPEPSFVERAWCLLELQAAVRADGCCVELQMADSDEDLFRLGLQDGSADKMWSRLKQTDIQTCRESASNKPSLVKRVAANSELINATVRSTLQEWFTEKAIRVLRHELRARDQRSLSACANLADLLVRAAEFGRAEEVLEEGQAQVRSLGAENTTDHASLLRVLALSKMEQRMHAEAEEAYRQAVLVYQMAGAIQTREYATTLEQLGRVLQALARPSEALSIYQDARKALEAAGKLYSEQGAELLLKMAACAKEANLGNEETALYQQAKEILEALGQTRSPTYMAVLENLGRSLMSQGQHGDALTLLLQAKAVMDAQDPSRFPGYGPLLTNIGECLFNLGRAQEAMRYFNRARANLSSAGLVGSVSHARLIKLMGLRLNLEGLHDEELALYFEAKEEFKAVGAENKPPYAELLSIIGEFLSGRSRFTEAMEYFAEAKAIWEALNAFDSPDYARLLRQMALCLASITQEAVNILED
mmetsp:Transcript_56417/g.132316  ORF Transcript_56417/g.132316 Transcript_56417/m.132316 type:complete len:812 (+) Transcript_56417:44-2479(+)